MIRKHLPALSLAACLAVLWSAWKVTVLENQAPRPHVPLAVAAPSIPPPARPVCVGLTPEPVRSVEFEVTGAFSVRPVGSSRVLLNALKLERTTVTATERGLKVGRHEFPTTRLEVVPDRSPAVWVERDQYRGSVRLYRQPGGLVLAVNVVSLEHYVASVVDSEMPADFPEEARKAQAVVARTYAVYQMRQAGPEALVDLYASTRSQKYLGYQYRDGDRLLAGETAAGRRAAADTAGQLCTYKGEVFCTYYCAVCGGSTVKGTEVFSDAAPPLQSVACDWCRDARLYRWTAEVSKRDAQTDLLPLLKKSGQPGRTLSTVSLVRASPGALPQFDVQTDRRAVRVTGAELRQALAAHGLYSPRFTVTDRGTSLAISGRGHGHGVGLCQWGARGLALAGKNYEQILQHYYAGARISRGTQTQPK
ncbi:MAG: SpoIID/LytB domain-containing protein [Planctomycetaceae bacterium]